MALPQIIQTALLDFYKIASSDSNPASVMPQIYAHLTAVWEDTLRANNYTPDFQCDKGCAYCCYLPVMCPPEVVFHVAEELRKTWKREDIDTLIDDISAIMDSFTKPHDIHDLRIRERCPFLDADNQCRIYGVRPISCRSFTSNNVSLCQSLAKLELETEDGVQQNQFRYLLHQAATSSLTLASKQTGRSYEQVFFLPAVREALLNPHLQDDWYSGKDAFGAINQA